MVGANHAAAASDLAIRYPNLEFVLTDPDADRLEQARTLLGDDVPQIRCLSWNELDGMPARSLDLAFAIDALSEVAAAPRPGRRGGHAEAIQAVTDSILVAVPVAHHER